MAASHNHPDIIHTFHSKPNYYLREEIKDQVLDNVVLRPFYGKYKLYIIDDAQLLTPQCQNALLKTLEDPPPYIVILLLCTSTSFFLETVRSRCTKLTIAPVADEIIMKKLGRDHQIPEYQARPILAFARGNLGKAISLSSNDEFSNLKRTTLTLLMHLADRPIPQLFTEAETLEALARQRMGELFDLILLWYRDVIVAKATSSTGLKRSSALLTFQEEEDSYAIDQASRKLGYPKIIENVQAIAKARKQLTEHVGSEKVLQQLILELL